MRGPRLGRFGLRGPGLDELQKRRRRAGDKLDKRLRGRRRGLRRMAMLLALRRCRIAARGRRAGIVLLALILHRGFGTGSVRRVGRLLAGSLRRVGGGRGLRGRLRSGWLWLRGLRLRGLRRRSGAWRGVSRSSAWRGVSRDGAWCRTVLWRVARGLLHGLRPLPSRSNAAGRTGTGRCGAGKRRGADGWIDHTSSSDALMARRPSPERRNAVSTISLWARSTSLLRIGGPLFSSSFRISTVRADRFL
jgi:hypothetical protein